MTHIVWNPAYIGVGSNLDRPERQVSEAIDALGTVARTEVVAVSNCVSNPPVGVTEQPDFVNAVVALLTQLPAHDLLIELQRIEHQQGRERKGDRWGPRTLDLDLLVFADEIIDEPSLIVPHERLAQRNFVLGPLLEIAPNLFVPGKGYVDKLARKVDLSTLSPITC